MIRLTLRIIQKVSDFSYWITSQLLSTKLGKFVSTHVGNLTSFLAKCIITFLIGIIIFIVSVVIYFAIYYSMMPTLLLNLPIHFHFSCHAGDRCEHPLGTVSLLDSDGSPFLHPHVYYTVVLNLYMPESQTNQNIGMFNVQLNLTDIEGALISSVTRSNMLRFRSPLHHTLRTFFFSPLLVFGYLEEEQCVSTVLYSGLLVHHELIPTSGWLQLRPGQLQLYHSQLTIHAQLRGLRWLMYRYPVLSAVIGTASLFFSLSLTAFLLWSNSLHLIWYKPDLRREKSFGYGDNSSSGGSTPPSPFSDIDKFCDDRDEEVSSTTPSDVTPQQQPTDQFIRLRSPPRAGWVQCLTSRLPNLPSITSHLHQQ